MNYEETASNIVSLILKDLKGRAGIGNALEEIDQEIYDMMAYELRDIVYGELVRGVKL